MVVVGSIFERRAAGIYHNTAVVSTPTARCAAVIARCTSPTTRSITKSTTSPPATSGFQAFDTSCARVGTLVCWDQWYPEAARLTALQGAEILFYPTAIGWHPAEKAEFGAAQAERLGDHPAVARDRQRRLSSRPSTGSATKDPRAAASSSGAARSWPIPSAGSSPGPASDTEEVLIATCDPRLQEETRRNWPFLRDRRIDAYAPITQRFLDRNHERSDPENRRDAAPPRQLGYRMPAEWEPHAATWIAWPHNRDDWPGKFAPIPWVYTEIVRHLSRVEKVHIVVRGGAMKRQRRRPARRSRGSTSTRSGSSRRPPTGSGSATRARRSSSTTMAAADGADPVGLIDWKFNGWAKYDNHRRDDRLPRKFERWLGLTALGAAGRAGGEPASGRDGGGCDRRQRPRARC